jgi:hypothetical protein
MDVPIPSFTLRRREYYIGDSGHIEPAGPVQVPHDEGGARATGELAQVAFPGDVAQMKVE